MTDILKERDERGGYIVPYPVRQSRPPTVYLCGGINGLSDAECRDWREAVKNALRGPVYLDPMRRDYRGREDEHVSEIVWGDYSDIGRADAVIANGTRPSWGTAMEIKEAHDRRKFVVTFVGETSRVSPWLKYHSTRIVQTVEQAVEVIRELSL